MKILFFMTRMQEAEIKARKVLADFQKEYETKRPKTALNLGIIKNKMLGRLDSLVAEYNDDPEIKKALNGLKNEIMNRTKLFD
jgi:hypothetical protein